MYEQGEIERNVALQTVAKRLKEENEKLRQENVLLKDRISQYDQEREEKEMENKRARDNSSPSGGYLDYPVRKRAKLSVDTIVLTAQPSRAIPLTLIPSPPSMASSPDSTGSSDDSFSPMALTSSGEEPTIFPSQLTLNGMFNFRTHGKQPAYDSVGSMDNFDCGFCNENTPCVCRELGIHHSTQRPDMASEVSFKAEAAEDEAPGLHDEAVPLRSPIPPERVSILDNLPAYQPPVPLRRRPVNPGLKTLFPVSPSTAASTTAKPTTSAPATCSGDPSNCLACADDVFGKAFCTAIGESVASDIPCADCPDRPQSNAVKNPTRLCCGNPGMCGSGSCTSSRPSPLTLPDSDMSTDTIPTNDAWRQLKSHPNVAFADLSLLADVVARRSKCTGPRVVISPPPRCITPERTVTPTPHQAISQISADESSDNHPILLTDPHAHYREKHHRQTHPLPSPPRLVPHEELVKCNRPRLVREVHAEAVRDALRLLDAKFGQM